MDGIYLTKMNTMESAPFVAAGFNLVNVSTEMSSIVTSIFERHFGTQSEGVLSYVRRQEPTVYEAAQRIGVNYVPLVGAEAQDQESLDIQNWLTRRMVRNTREPLRTFWLGQLLYADRVLPKGPEDPAPASGTS